MKRVQQRTPWTGAAHMRGVMPVNEQRELIVVAFGCLGVGAGATRVVGGSVRASATKVLELRHVGSYPPRFIDRMAWRISISTV